MVREIINIQVGECGNQIGSKFWEMISREHCLFEDGTYKGQSDYELENIGVYFNENKRGKYIPRAILIDMDEEIMNITKSSQFLQLINHKNVIYGHSSSETNWGSYFYNYDSDFVTKIYDQIRKEAENCDSLQGFHFIHSLGGATGSGLGSLIINDLRDEYPDETISTFSVFPSKETCSSQCDLCNCALSLEILNESSDQIFYFDNDYLYKLALNKLRLSTPTFDDLNYCITCEMSGATCSLRFPGLLNSDLRKMSINLIPISRFKLLRSTFANQTSELSTRCHTFTVDELTSILFDKNIKYDDVDVSYLAASLNFHGRFFSDKVYEKVKIVNSTFHNVNVNVSISPKIIDGHSKSATLIENSSTAKKLLERQRSDFWNSFQRGYFIHKYINEGVDYVEFDFINENLKNLILEYEAYYSNN